jgi:hypothetical protein
LFVHQNFSEQARAFFEPKREVDIMGVNIETGSCWKAIAWKEGSLRGDITINESQIKTPTSIPYRSVRSPFTGTSFASGVLLRSKSRKSEIAIKTNKAYTLVEGDIPSEIWLKGQVLFQEYTVSGLPSSKGRFVLIGIEASLRVSEPTEEDYFMITNIMDLGGKEVSR